MTEKNYVVIGGSHGIGLGIVESLAANGDSVTVVSRTPGGLADLPGVVHVQADVVKDDINASSLPESIDGEKVADNFPFLQPKD